MYQKKIPETDAIFKRLAETHQKSAKDETTLRISIDAKATIKLGNLSRGGKSRIPVNTLDHDFVRAEDKVHLLGFYLPYYGENFFFLLPSSLTADAIVDCMEVLWEMLKPRFGHIKKLLFNFDNGPDNNTHRTQFMARLVKFVDNTGLEIELAYYPPYHSKYNPIERVWGVLEQHWNGSSLDSLKTVVQMAKTMTYKGLHPVVTIVKKTYQKGVSLTKKAMKEVEKRLQRSKELPKYFVSILTKT